VGRSGPSDNIRSAVASLDVVVVGGCGHVGLPLGLAFASRGLRTAVYDINQVSVETVSAGTMPFNEPGAPEVLRQVLEQGTFRATSDPQILSEAESVVVVIGTPIDKHLNPEALEVPGEIAKLSRHFVDGQLLVLRSTLYPGVTALVEQKLAADGREIDVAFCPERIAEGKAMVELFSLPQLVSGRTAAARERAGKLFLQLTAEVVELTPEEAELAKLFTNTWRYIKFATANQLFMIANDFGLDYSKIREALARNYPRAHDMPSAGLAAGPCLLKDTMQLAAFNNNQFTLGHSAMLINEGLPLYTVAKLERRFRLSELTVGVLGMAFKADSDDIRSSLSYRLKRILAFKAKRVLCTDPYVLSDPDLVPLEQVLREADLLVIGAPHEVYRQVATDLPVVDLTNLRGQGSLV